MKDRTVMKEHRTTNIEHRTSNDGEDTSFADSGPRPKVIDISENLPRTRAGNHVAGQLLRSGTLPYSNHGEAESAESSDDFIHKLKVCLKELRETKRWLRLIHRKAWLRTGKELAFALNEVEELIRIFVASIRTASKNRRLALEP